MSHGRGSLKVKAARLFQHLPLGWLRGFEYPALWAKRGDSTSARLIVLLALPRSGSTLTYQTLIHSLHPVYLSNLSNLLYMIPLLGGWLSKHKCSGYISDFRSDHGFVEGVCGPAEGLRFWRYWFGCGLDERENMAELFHSQRAEYLARVLALLSDAEKPVVTGYLGHALATENLRNVFPQAMFVRLQRNLLDNAYGILLCRRSGGGKWFSVFPRECIPYQDSDIYRQVAAQVYWLNRRLDLFTETTSAFHLTYEDLCDDPAKQIDRVMEHGRDYGMKLSLYGKLPPRFQRNIVHEDDNEDTKRLASALREMEQEHGSLRTHTHFNSK